MASSSCASRPYTASQPGFTITLPLVWKLCETSFAFTVEMRVVTMNSAGGKNTARKRLTTMSYSFASISDRLFGACSVGMIAKWSDTLALSKMRLLGFT